MRILNVIQCTNLGGMERASVGLMTALQARGHSLRLVSVSPLGSLAPVLAAAGIPSEGVAYCGPAGLWSRPELRRRLVAHAGWADAMLMTGHNLMAMTALGGICRGRRVLAQHFHHTGVMAGWKWRLVYQLARRQFRAVVFPSDFIRAEAVALHPPLGGGSRVVRYPFPLPPIPTPADRTAARAALGLPLEARVVANGGWLIRRKRWDLFLAVAARVAAADPRAVFLIAGDGPDRPVLEARAAAPDLAGRVRFAGWQTDMTPVYRSADLYLFHADWDAFPMAPQEAISYGLPVVGSVAHSGIHELTDRAQPGLLLRRHDVPAVADLAVALLADPGRRGEVGRAARSALGRMGDPAEVARQYEELLAGRDRP